MRYSQKINRIVCGRGQRLFEVTPGKTTKLFVNMISQDRSGGHISYVAYGFIILRGRHYCFVEFRGQVRSPEVKSLVNTILQGRNHGYFLYLAC